MNRCTCNRHSHTEPGYVFCPVDHTTIASDIDALREQVMASRIFREEAFESEGLDRITNLPADADPLDVARAVTQTYQRFLDLREAHGVARYPLANQDDSATLEVLQKLVNEYAPQQANA